MSAARTLALLAASAMAVGACAIAEPASRTQPPASNAPAGGSSVPVMAGQACPPGELAQWRADVCMASTGTDDLVAAGECLEKEGQLRFRDDCDGKQHYKRRLCELARDEGPRRKSVDECMADPGFMGATVRNNGM